jgi:hypothetical protein
MPLSILYVLVFAPVSTGSRLRVSAHGLRAVEGLSDDVGVASMLGSLRDDVQKNYVRLRVYS